jgi:hypothetical protein
MTMTEQEECGMKRLAIFGVTAAMLAAGGCVYVDGPYEPWTGSGEEHSGRVYEPYVDTWLSPPRAVLVALEPHVTGWFTPALSRYDSYLYPPDKPYSCCDLPPYVRADFNGDFIDDYAFLFSSEYDAGDEWELTTRLLVVMGSADGPYVEVDIVLGTVIGEWSAPIEEYWAIGLVPAGSHTLTTYHGGVEVSETVYLEDDAFYLAELESVERSLFYADGWEVYEMGWFDGDLAKRRGLAKRKPRTIRLSEITRAETPKR